MNLFPGRQSDDACQDHFFGVPAQNHNFVGRQNILAKMKEEISSSTSGGCRPVALSGLGGMGKTQLMLQYCYLHRAEYQYVFWLEVEDKIIAVDSFRRLAVNLGLDVTSLEKDSEGKVVEWVRKWLEKRTGWLLRLTMPITPCPMIFSNSFISPELVAKS